MLKRLLEKQGGLQINSLERFETVLHYLYVDDVVNSAERFGTVLHYLPIMFIDSVERF